MEEGTADENVETATDNSSKKLCCEESREMGQRIKRARKSREGNWESRKMKG